MTSCAHSACYSNHWLISLPEYDLNDSYSFEFPSGYFQTRSSSFNQPFVLGKRDQNVSFNDELDFHLETVNDLLSEEPNSKYALKFKLSCLVLQKQFEEAKGIAKTLETIDSFRKGYYSDLHDKLELLFQILQNIESSKVVISRNKMRIPQTIEPISEMKKIRWLSLTNCSLKDMKFISYFVNLEELDLSQNQLACIDQSIGTLEKLKVVNLTSNQIGGNYESFEGLKWLADKKKLILHLNDNKCSSSDILKHFDFLQLVNDHLVVNSEFTDQSLMLTAVKESLKSNKTNSAYCVGAVLVESVENEIISKGFSRELEGNTHAEECALLKLQKPDIAKKYTMYTSMLPCIRRLSEKKSCVERLIESGIIDRVVYGAEEPHFFVENQEAQKKLEKAGIQSHYIDMYSKECVKIINGHIKKE